MFCKSRGLRRGEVAGIVAVAALFATIPGCAPQRPTPPPPAPAPVTVSAPIVQSIVDYEETTGRAEAFDFVEVRSQVTGYLDKITFKSEDPQASPGAPLPALREGDTVAVGTLLFEIDPRPFQAVYDGAVAESERAQAALVRLTADLARAENLRTTNNISVEEFDKIAASKVEAQATVAQTKAQIDAAKTNLDYTKIRAPITGRLGNAMVSKGNLVTAQMTLLTTIVREDPIYVYFDLPEQVVERYRNLIREDKFTSARDHQLPVEIGLGSEEGFPHVGFIDFIDNKINRDTASLRLRGRFENPELAYKIRNLTPGMFVRVRLAASRPHEAILVGERTIQSDRGDKVVYVVDADGTARRRVVQLGALHGRLREVTSGLKADDRIVVNGLQRVRDGAKVQPENGPMPGLPAATPTATASPTGSNAPQPPTGK